MSVVMENGLLKGWSKTSIDDISINEKYSIRMGPFGSQLKKHELVDSGIRVLWIENIVNNRFEYKIGKFITKKKYKMLKGFSVKPNDVLVTMMGTIGRTCIVPQDIGSAIISSHLLKITPNMDLIMPVFLTYLLRGNTQVIKQIESKARGVVMKGLNTKIIKSLQFFLPPLNEQKRIVAKIEELFSLVDSAKDTMERTRILLKQYRQSILKQAFEGKLMPQDPNDEPASVLLEKIKGKNLDKKFSDVIMEELPKEWIMVLLSDIATTKSGGTPSRKNPDNFDGNIPWLKSGELNDSYILNSDEKISKYALENSNATIFPKGTILIAMYGATIGKLGILEINASTNQAICGIQHNKEIIFQKFLFNYLLFKKKSLINLGFGGAQNNISQNIIRTIKIVIPPLNEQKRIVAKIEESFSLIEKNEKIVDQLLIQFNQIKNSILKQAFEGKLVPQDPNDEPAEILLQRIKEEKKKNGK